MPKDFFPRRIRSDGQTVATLDALPINDLKQAEEELVNRCTYSDSDEDQYPIDEFDQELPAINLKHLL